MTGGANPAPRSLSYGKTMTEKPTTPEDQPEGEPVSPAEEDGAGALTVLAGREAYHKVPGM